MITKCTKAYIVKPLGKCENQNEVGTPAGIQMPVCQGKFIYKVREFM